MNPARAGTSPYLLKDAGNPVGWYPRGAEAAELRNDQPLGMAALRVHTGLEQPCKSPSLREESY